MKPILHFSSIPFRHNLLYKAFLFLLLLNIHVSSNAQCTNATLNWDNMDYFHRNGGVYGGTNPVTTLPFVTTTMAQTQYFAFGTNKLTMTLSANIAVGTASSVYGDVVEHTGETGAYGTGADIKFIKTGTGNVSVTLTFASEVTNVQFSVFDVDQEITFNPTATNALGVAQSITLTKPAGIVASTIPLTATYPTAGTNVATVTGTVPAANWTTGGGSGTAYAVTSNAGTINVDIAGPVKTIVLNFSQDGNTNDIFLSDITACTPNPGFPSSYYATYTTPYTNQPAYFLANPQNLHVYRIDASSGQADYIFSDPGGTPAGTNKMNSLAYDPINHWLYYTMDNATQYPGNLVLKKYDFTTGSISTVISNLATFGIPSFIQGVEYAGAAFYNGSLYLGIEGSDGTSYSTYGESVVWRIDFDGSGNPTGYCQAFGTPGDVGTGTPSHDWGDFIVKDGVIITHATGPTTALNHYIHYNLQTGASTSYAGGAGVAGQLGQIYNGNVYKIDSTVSLYNNNGTVSLVGAVAVTSCSPAWYLANKKNSAGDASDPFRPMQDFGDAPATYDPVALTVAANQKSCNNSTLRIGSAWGDEWIKNILTTDASGDDEEDGITAVTIMVSDGVAYNHVQDVVVLNNTGANAYLAGWLDYNANGVFNASEGVIVTVPSSASPQTISLGWTGITVAIGTANSFLRVRLSSSVMTTSSATGWFTDGETEDYPVISQANPLAIKLLDFNATLTRDKNVLLSWKAYSDNKASGFEIERSNDQNNWENIGSININTSAFTADYSFLDQQPLQGKSYYRLKLIEKSGSSRNSNTRLIQIDNLITNLKVFPNPVKNDVTISFNGLVNESATLYVRSLSGKVMIKRPVALNPGDNRVSFTTNALSNGMYIVELVTTEKTFINKLTVSH